MDVWKNEVRETFSSSQESLEKRRKPRKVVRKRMLGTTFPKTKS
jgi:hypothetical protein